MIGGLYADDGAHVRAAQKMAALEDISVEVVHGKIDQFQRMITLKGDLDAEQRARLLEIADKCPVHRTMEREIDVVTGLV